MGYFGEIFPGAINKNGHEVRNKPKLNKIYAYTLSEFPLNISNRALLDIVQNFCVMRNISNQSPPHF